MVSLAIFYHLFAVKGWREIWNVHRHHLLASGLYDACESLRVGVVYKRVRQLHLVQQCLAELPKASLLYSRQISSLPLLWPDPPVRSPDGRLGESETILRMCKDAQSGDEVAEVCLFLHTKGVTNPSWRKRGNLPYFQRQGLVPGATNRQINDFVLHHLLPVVKDWRQHVASLEHGEFSYRLFNFFWVRRSLLCRFDFNDYVARHALQAPPVQRRYRLDGGWNARRHIFALFPIKLWAFVNDVTLSRPPREYIDVTK